MAAELKSVYSFGHFRFDASNRLLFAGDEVVSLTPKVFDTLMVLVENGGRVLSKEELMRLVWPDQFVEENNLAQNIHAIRKALRDAGASIERIETIPKRGYRFKSSVESLSKPPEGKPDLGAQAAGPARERVAGSVALRSAQSISQPATLPANLPPEPIIPKTQLLGKAIARLAPFGEVLVSHTVKDLVAGSGIKFEPRGAQRFDDLAGEWRLFAVERGSG